jgi:hypothetical protein
MAKSQRKSRSGQPESSVVPSTSQPRLLIDRLADAALIVALFTVLAFSEIRFEGFETEKTALLPILGGIILASHITHVLKHRAIPYKHQLFNPMVIGVIGIIITSTISSALGFSPIRSWFGEAERLSGLQSLLVYILLFSQAIRSADRITARLTPIVTSIAAPLCVSVLWAQFIQGVYRPGSTTGNPNYLSSWLVMSMLILIVLLFIRIQRITGDWHWNLLPQLLFAPLLVPIPLIIWTISKHNKNHHHNWSWRDWLYLLLVLFMLVFMTVTILAVGSRAALLSYAIGGVTTIGIILVIARQKRLLILFSSAVIIAGISYITISTITPRDIKSTFRILSLGDSRRQELWRGAVSVINQQSVPFTQLDGTPDPLASVRPIVGYGLSVIPQTQGRIGATSHQNQFIGSYHNHIFDSIIMSGYLGMLMYVAFYLGAIIMTLRLFRLIRDDLFRWTMTIVFFGILGTLFTPSLFPDADYLNVVPIGITLGVLGGNFIWIAGQIYRRTDYQQTGTTAHITARQVLLAGLLGIIILRWVDIQFAFVQAASEPLFWTLAGLFLGHYNKLHLSVTDSTPSTYSIDEARPIDWQIAILATGVMIFYGFGTTVNSDVYQHTIGVERVPFFIGILLIIGYLMAWLVTNKQHQLSRVITGITPVVWLVMWAIKSFISNTAGTLFNQTFAADTITEPRLFATLFLLSLTGVAMITILLFIWTLYDSSTMSIRHPLAIASAMMLGLIGMSFYMSNFTSATAHAVGIGFMETGSNGNNSKPYDIAEAAFQVATHLDPSNARLRVHYIGMLTQQALTFPDSHADTEQDIAQNLNTLVQYEPYFIHTIEWAQFSNYYARVFGKNFEEALYP